MKLAGGVIFVAAALAADAASAQPAGATVSGGGFARDCWQATRNGEAAARFERTCSSALDFERLTPQDRAATLVNRGIIRLRQKRYDQAIEDFNLALRYRPQFAEAFVNRGAASVGLRRFTEGLDDLTRALAMGVQRPEKALYNRGLAYEGLDDLGAAARDYQRALEFAPNWELLKRRLARLSAGQRDLDVEPQT